MTGKRKRIMALAVALMALVTVGTLSAQYPKARSAEDAERVDVPEAMVEFFESKGVNLSGIDPAGSMPETVETAIREVYEETDSFGDRVYSSRVNGLAMRAMEVAYDEVDRPVYLEFGPLYWGYWTAKDGLNESDL